MSLFSKLTRRRNAASLSEESLTVHSRQASGSSTPVGSDDGKNGNGYKKQLETELRSVRRQLHRPFIAKRRFLFPLGLIIGSFFGLSLLGPSVPSDLALLLVQYDIDFDLGALFTRIQTVMPDVDWSRLDAEWNSLTIGIPELWKMNNDGREYQVGEKIHARGLSAKHPVVLIPGVISTSLESWSTSPEFRSFFRQKMWGGFSMVSQVTFNRDKWMAALMLDPQTGLDPPGVRVRASQGVDAASSFVQGYWIWSKIIENLAVVGYDTNNLLLAAYDWRLSLWNLEERDRYFSRLKSSIELFKTSENRKVVLAAHSMGSTVTLYLCVFHIPTNFPDLKWVEAPEHGGGGPSWVEDHIEAFISVAGTHFGVAKSMTAFLSGEMKDTVELNPMGAYVLERFFSRKERAKLFRSWAGSASMWIKGGEDVWGNSISAPDDQINSTHTHGRFISFRSAANETGVQNMTAHDAATWILSRMPTHFQRMLGSNYSYGIERDEAALTKNDRDHRKWSNPLESRLPHAPSMKIYCVYGYGKDTERSYWYASAGYEHDDVLAEAVDAQCADESENCAASDRTPLDLPLSRRHFIDAEYYDEKSVPKVKHGVTMGEGDGTVSLLSLGAMCVEGWKHKRWNPAGIKVITNELPHNPTPNLPRGGANTSDHVDILGSTALNDIIVKVAVGAGDEVQDTIVSDIRRYAAAIQWD